MISGTYFTGGGLVDVALEECGFNSAFGVEYDDKIANVARLNGFPVRTMDVRAVNPADLPHVDWFHASPVCKNASTANSDGEESAEDIETAQAVERYIDFHEPFFFSLENVFGYRTFAAFQNILACLTRNNYAFDYWHLNAADYGVPQTRKRLILVARRDGYRPRKPIPTHTQQPTVLFETRTRWVGWYEAIEDLIPYLPESKFADWQIPKLPREMRTFMMQVQGEGGDGILFADEPMQTVTANHGASKYRAYLVDSAGFDGEVATRASDEPSGTIVSNYAKRPLLAWLINESSTMEIRSAGQPAATQLAKGRNGGLGQRALLETGRVVSITPRPLARLQSIPDTFALSGTKTIDCTVIGNSVPPLMMGCVIKAQTGVLK